MTRLSLLGLLFLCAGFPWLWLQDIKPPWRQWGWTKGVMLCGYAAVIYLFPIEPALAFAGLSILLRWKPIEDQMPLTGAGNGPLILWAAISATWFLARLAPPELRITVVCGWLVIALLNTWLVWGHWLALHRWLPEFPSVWLDHTVNRYAGTFGQRTFLGAFFALLTPLAFLFPSPWSWIIAAILIGVQITAMSFLGFIALFIAAAVLFPRAAPGIIAGLLFLGGAVAGTWVWKLRVMRDSWLDKITTRSGSLDSVGVRWRHWTGAWAVWRQWPVWLIGRGIGAGWGDSLRVQVGRSTKTAQSGHLHNDWAEFAYEHGLLGVAAIISLAWRVLPGLHLGDPWTASAVAGAVLASGTYAARIVPVAGVWWIVLAWIAP